MQSYNFYQHSASFRDIMENYFIRNILEVDPRFFTYLHINITDKGCISPPNLVNLAFILYPQMYEQAKANKIFHRTYVDFPDFVHQMENELHTITLTQEFIRLVSEKIPRESQYARF